MDHQDNHIPHTTLVSCQTGTLSPCPSCTPTVHHSHQTLDCDIGPPWVGRRGIQLFLQHTSVEGQESFFFLLSFYPTETAVCVCVKRRGIDWPVLYCCKAYSYIVHPTVPTHTHIYLNHTLHTCTHTIHSSHHPTLTNTHPDPYLFQRYCLHIL